MASNPSGYTTNYGIKKYADASDPGGTALNSNSDIIDAAIKAVADDVLELQTGSLVGYTEFCANVSQTGTSAPTVTVLNNTVGTVDSIIYTDVGIYQIVFVDNVLTAGKTENVRETILNTDGERISIIGYVCAFRSTSKLYIINTNDPDFNAANEILDGGTASNLWTLKFRVYP